MYKIAMLPAVLMTLVPAFALAQDLAPEAATPSPAEADSMRIEARVADAPDASVSIEFLGLDLQPVPCLTAVDLRPGGNLAESVITAVIPASCHGPSTYPMFRIVIDGLVAGVFDFEPGKSVDLGRLKPTSDPFENVTAPNAGLGLGPSVHANDGTGPNSAYLYAAYGLFAAAGLLLAAVVASSLLRRGASKPGAPR